LAADRTFVLPSADGTSGQALTTDGSGNLAFSTVTTPTTLLKNRIINGAMVIDQRNAGASVTPTVLFNTYTLDRWGTSYSQASKFSVQQNAGSVTPPTGFTKYLGVTSLSAYSVASGEAFAVYQNVEGFNLADLGWGTASAKTVTLSFWVRSSLTGTFGGSLRNSAADRSYPYSYTISVADTWEQKSITITGDTSGTWLTDNGAGVQVSFSIGVGTTRSGTAGAWAGANYLSATGATSVVGTNGATFYITGVQLEVGTQATSFEYRQYGTELSLCQRYFTKLGGTTSNEGIAAGNLQDVASSGWFCVNYPTTMRAAPTAAYSSLRATNNADYNLAVSSIRGQVNGIDSSNIGFNFSSSGTTYAPVQLQTSATSGFLSFSSEL
jgi:hypothetical protein